MIVNEPFEISAKIDYLQEVIQEYYCQPVINSEGDIVSYADWEEENKD